MVDTGEVYCLYLSFPNKANEMPEALSLDSFFSRESSWTLTHSKGEAHIVVFSTQNGLALSVAIFILGHSDQSAPHAGHIDTKHFPALTTQAAFEAAVEWARHAIDPNLKVTKAV